MTEFMNIKKLEFVMRPRRKKTPFKMYCIIVLLRTLRTAFRLDHSNLWNLGMLDPEGEWPSVFLYSAFQLLKCIQICSCQVSGH